MAMNDDYRLVISGESGDLENSLKAIEAYMDALEGKDIDAPLDNFLKKLKVIAKEVKNVQDTMGSQEGKSVVSAKDMDKTIESTRSATKHMNDLKKALDDVQNENISNGIAPDPEVEKAYKKINAILKETHGNLENVSEQKIGSDASINNRIKDMKTLNQVTEEYSKLTDKASDTKDYTKRLRANRNMTRNYMERSEGSGRLTYDQGTRVQKELGSVGELEKRRRQNNKDLTTASTEFSGYKQAQQHITNQRANNQIGKAEYEKQLASIKTEIDAREKAIASFRELDKELNKSISYYKNDASEQYASRDVDQQRGTFGRMIQERLPSIGSHAMMGATGMATGLYMKGASLSETNRPMVTSLGQNADNTDIDAMRNTYGDLSIDNKLGYNSTDMLKMATGYEASVGHKSDEDTMKGTEQLALGGRSLGVQDQEAYRESMNQIMHTGGVDSGNMKEIQDAFLGGIKQSGMVGRQDEQLKALGSIAEQSGQGRTLAESEMNNLTAMQATFAESGSKGLQGEQGANAMNAIDQGIKNSDSNFMDIAYGRGTEYQGLEGAYDLQKRKDKGISDPENITDIADSATNYGSNEKEQKLIFNKALKEMGADLTIEQSDEIFKDSQEGKLSKEELAKKAKKMEKEGKKEGKDNATEYSESDAGKNDQNKAKTDDKAEDTYDLAQPLRNAHSALAGMNTMIYLAIGAVGAFTASLLGSAGMFGAGSLVGKGAKAVGRKWKNRKGGNSGGGSMMPGGGGDFGGKTKPDGGTTPKTPNDGGGKAGGSTSKDSGGKSGGSKMDKVKGLGGSLVTGGMLGLDWLTGGDNRKGGNRSGKDQAKGVGKGLKDFGGSFMTRDFSMKDYMKRTKDGLKKAGGGLKDFGKETHKGGIFSGLGGKIKGQYGKFADKFGEGGKSGVMNGGMGKVGGVAKGLMGRMGAIGAGISGIGIGSSLLKGDKEGASKGLGDFVDPFGLGYGKHAEKTANKAQNTKGLFGKGGMIDFSWNSGEKDKKGKKKNGFKDSVIGKPLTKLGGGIASIFGGGDEDKKDSKKGKGGKGGKASTGLGATQSNKNGKKLGLLGGIATGFGLLGGNALASEEDEADDKKGKDKEKGVKGVKKDNKKKEKMTAEQLREKNNQSETKNLEVYKNLLDRAQKIIESAKGLNLDGGGTEGGDSGGSASDVGGEGAEKMYKFLKGKDLSDNQVGAIMGNLQQESELDPTAVNPSSGAFGIAQWLGARKTGLDKFAKSEGKKNTDLDVQLDYLWKEMQSDYESNNLKNAGWSKGASLEKNTEAFATGFERMGANEAMMSKRVSNAKGFKEKYGGGGSGGGGGASSSTYEQTMSNPILSTGSNYKGSNDANNGSGVNNRINITVNVQGGDNPEETGNIIGERINEKINSNLDLFANSTKRVY